MSDGSGGGGGGGGGALEAGGGAGGRRLSCSWRAVSRPAEALQVAASDFPLGWQMGPALASQIAQSYNNLTPPRYDSLQPCTPSALRREGQDVFRYQYFHDDGHLKSMPHLARVPIGLRLLRIGIINSCASDGLGGVGGKVS